MAGGIYTITSPSGKQYVGSAVHFQKRLDSHFWKLRKGSHHSPHLQHAYNKYGENALVFEKLLICDKKDLLFYEQRAIDILKPAYNVCKVAGNTLGLKFSPAVVEKIKQSQTVERRANLSQKLTGIKRSAETKLKISKAKKGKSTGPHSEQTKLKISESNKGKHHSPEWCANSSAALKGLTKGKKKPDSFGAKVSKARSVPVQCLETGQIFPSGKAAGEWCKITGYTASEGATGMINRAVALSTTAYGLHWIKLDKGNE